MKIINYKKTGKADTMTGTILLSFIPDKNLVLVTSSQVFIGQYLIKISVAF